MADAREPSRALIDLVDRKAVVPPVRAIDKSARRSHLDIGAGALPPKILRQRRDDLQFLESSTPAVIRQDRHRGIQLVDEVGPLAVGMEHQMTRTGPRLHLKPGNRIRFQHPPPGIQAINQELVQSEIGHEGKAIGGVQCDRVGMGTRLAGGVDARPLMLKEVGGFPQATVPPHGQDTDAPAHEIGHVHVGALLVHQDVARIGPVRRLRVEKRQVSRLRLHPERADAAARLAFVALQLVDGV